MDITTSLSLAKRGVDSVTGHSLAGAKFSLKIGKLKSRRSTGTSFTSADENVFCRIGWMKAATFDPIRAGRRLMVMRATDFAAIFAMLVQDFCMYVIAHSKLFISVDWKSLQLELWRYRMSFLYYLHILCWRPYI